MNYWPAEVTNLGNTTEPLYSLIKDLSVTVAQTAREMYGCRGWMAHHNTDIWRIAGPVDGAQWGMFPNGRCLAHHPSLAALSLYGRQGFPQAVVSGNKGCC